MNQDQQWIDNNIPSQNGKIILITGANTGLGYESAKALAGKGAHLIIACRSIQKGEDARAKIQESFPEAVIDIQELDLSSLSSVRKAAKEVLDKYSKLDVLMNNAGIMMTPYSKTEDGFESQIGTNHFGHFLLTSLLFPLLKSTPNARIVNVSSLAHLSGNIDFNNVNFEDSSKYSPMAAYQNSKLANLMFSHELKKRVDEAGLRLKVVTAHPGVAMTELVRHLEKNPLIRLLRPLVKLLTNTAEGGALSQLYAATSAEVKSGDYYGPGGWREYRGVPKQVECNRRSKNPELTRQLWDISEELCDTRFEL